MLASHPSYEQSAAAEASEKASLLNGMVGTSNPQLSALSYVLAEVDWYNQLILLASAMNTVTSLQVLNQVQNLICLT